MDSNLTIKLIEPSDSIQELTDLLHRAYAALGAMGLNYTAVDQSPEVTAKRVASGACFIAMLSGEIVGTVVVTAPDSNSPCEYFRNPRVAAAHQFAVSPDHQNLGIGASLIDQAQRWAQGEGCSELALDTAEQASHLIRLYEGWGFSRVGWVQWSGKVYRSVVLAKLI